MTATQDYIFKLQSLKPGDLGRLRKLACLPLDESVDGFDLFAGLWWPLRRENQRAPRREVAWLIAKLFAFCPMPQCNEVQLPALLGRIRHADERTARRWQMKFDRLLVLPLSRLEPSLQWALDEIRADAATGLNWVSLTDDLSFWERESTRLKWAKQYLKMAK